jgi:predicted nuclease of predicted toxin-antitoxin system
MDVASLNILADENIATSVVAFLRNQGIGVVDVKEQKWFGESDRFLLEQSYLNKQFVLTQDSDFGTLVLNEGQGFYGIIYLRLKDQRPQHVIDVLARLMKLDIQVSPQTIIVVKDKLDDDEILVRIRRHQNL